jgi:hypothetical protein
MPLADLWSRQQRAVDSLDSSELITELGRALLDEYEKQKCMRKKVQLGALYGRPRVRVLMESIPGMAFFGVPSTRLDIAKSFFILDESNVIVGIQPSPGTATSSGSMSSNSIGEAPAPPKDHFARRRSTAVGQEVDGEDGGWVDSEERIYTYESIVKYNQCAPRYDSIGRPHGGGQAIDEKVPIKKQRVREDEETAASICGRTASAVPEDIIKREPDVHTHHGTLSSLAQCRTATRVGAEEVVESWEDKGELPVYRGGEQSWQDAEKVGEVGLTAEEWSSFWNSEGQMGTGSQERREGDQRLFRQPRKRKWE